MISNILTKFKICVFISFLCINIHAQDSVAIKNITDGPIVRLETSKGVIRMQLSNLTPVHRDNFLELVRSGYYDNLLFHRVIRDFMIQTGDQNTRVMPKGKRRPKREEYTLMPEFKIPELYHRRGAVCMAREADDENPERRSSGFQFYIVWGKTFKERSVLRMYDDIKSKTGIEVKYTLDMIDDYFAGGGTPYLDATYTVFGQVIEGMEVVDAIQQTPTASTERPLEDICIIKATVE